MLLIQTVCRKPFPCPRRQTGSHKNRLVLCSSAVEHRSMKAVARIPKGMEYLLISPSLNTTLCKLKALYCYILCLRLISLAVLNSCQSCILYIIINNIHHSNFAKVYKFSRKQESEDISPGHFKSRKMI